MLKSYLNPYLVKHAKLFVQCLNNYFYGTYFKFKITYQLKLFI
jgi:hypothetical protein